MDLSRILSSPSSLQIPQADPLKIIAEGSVISVEVALDEKTGKLGIKFNGVFYTAELPKDAKLGELLKVILKAQGDQILLKLLEGSDQRLKDVDHTFHPTQGSILTKEEKKIIREMLLASRTPEVEVETAPVVNQRSGEPGNNIKAVPHSNKNIFIDAPETTGPQAPVRSSLTPEKLMILDKVEGRVEQSLPLMNEPQPVRSNRIAEQMTVIKAQLQEIVAQPNHEMQNVLIAQVVKDLLQPLMQTMTKSSGDTEDIFKLIKQVFTRQIENIVPFVQDGGAPLEALNDLPIQRGIKKEVSNSEKNFISKASIKNVLREESSRSEVREVLKQEKIILEPLRSALNQIQSATEALQKLQTSSGYKGEGVYFLLPFFVQPKVRFAECCLSPHESNEKDREEKRRRPRLLKMRIHLSEIGEVVVELLSHGSDVHMNLFVETEYARQSILSSKDILEKFFRDENINAKTIDVFVSAKKAIAPSVIAQELNIELRA